MEQNLDFLHGLYPELRITTIDDPKDPARLQYRFWSGWTRTVLLLSLPRDHVLTAEDPQPPQLLEFYKKHKQIKDDDDWDDGRSRTTGDLASLWRH